MPTIIPIVPAQKGPKFPNKELAKKIKEEAYNLILEEYDWNKVIEKYLKLYNDILGY